MRTSKGLKGTFFIEQWGSENQTLVRTGGQKGETESFKSKQPSVERVRGRGESCLFLKDKNFRKSESTRKDQVKECGGEIYHHQNLGFQR